MPEVATTHVWITVFSCRVKGCFNKPDLLRNFVHVLTKKNPKSPAETLSDGMIPVVRLSFITMNVNMMPKTKLHTNARTVSWFCHFGTSLLSNILSIDSISPDSLVCFPSLSLWSSSRRDEDRSIVVWNKVMKFLWLCVWVYYMHVKRVCENMKCWMVYGSELSWTESCINGVWDLCNINSI